MRLLFLTLLFAGGFAAFAGDNLLTDGGFEAPVVKGRTPVAAGGDPTNNGRGPGWVIFQFKTTGTNGKVAGGLTDEVARTGRQSLFIRFDHASAPFESAKLISNFIPVASGTDYQVGIWGRTDAKERIDAEGRTAYLKLEVDFFARDADESVGDPYYKVLHIPGGGEGREPEFRPDRWTRFYGEVTSPPGAVFAQITWSWETGEKPDSDTGEPPADPAAASGEVNGIIFFDDAEMAGPAAPIPNLTPSPVQEEPAPTPSASSTPSTSSTQQ